MTLGEWVGALTYMAPEAKTPHEVTDWRPADVYSLAKTFWKIATGAKYPPPGWQIRTDKSLTLCGVLPESDRPKARILDCFMEQATKHKPSERPTIENFVVELRNCLADVQPPDDPANLSDLAQRARELAQPGYDREEMGRRRQAIENEICESAKKALKPFHDGLLRDFREMTRPQIFPNELRNLFNLTGCDIQDMKCVFVGIKSKYPRNMNMYFAIGFKLVDGKQVLLHGLWGAEEKGVPAPPAWSTSRTAALGSAQQTQALREIAGEISQESRRAIEHFLRKLKG